jgi:hypothetical protein
LGVFDKKGLLFTIAYKNCTDLNLKIPDDLNIVQRPQIQTNKNIGEFDECNPTPLSIGFNYPW